MIWTRLDWSPELADGLPGWMREGAFGLLPLDRAAWDRLPRRSAGSRVWLRSREGDERELLGGIGWILEPSALLADLVREAGRMPRRLLPSLPLPGPALRWLRSREERRRWMDPTAAADALAVLAGEAHRGGVFPPFEPGPGELIVCLSHEADVRSLARGGGGRRLLDLERRHGFASTWFLSVGRRRPDWGLLDSLACEGHELGWTDAAGASGLPFSSPQSMKRRLEASRGFLERFGVRGSRAPGFLRTPAYVHTMARHFAYDSSRLDGQPPARGCGTCRPFRDMGGLLQLPVSVRVEPADGDPRDSAARHLAALERARLRGGLAVVSVPTPPEGEASRGGAAAYELLLEGLASLPRCRRTLLKQVAADCAGASELMEIWRDGIQAKGGRT